MRKNYVFQVTGVSNVSQNICGTFAGEIENNFLHNSKISSSCWVHEIYFQWKSLRCLKASPLFFSASSAQLYVCSGVRIESAIQIGLNEKKKEKKRQIPEFEHESLWYMWKVRRHGFIETSRECDAVPFASFIR